MALEMSEEEIEELESFVIWAAMTMHGCYTTEDIPDGYQLTSDACRDALQSLSLEDMLEYLYILTTSIAVGLEHPEILRGLLPALYQYEMAKGIFVIDSDSIVFFLKSKPIIDTDALSASNRKE